MWSVHPRLRGELGMAAKIAAATAGSSPLTRGTLTEYLSKWPASRFIPAYAGNSLPVNPTSTEGPVHPRLRGELMVYGTAQDAAGFIPAYAGNSKSRPGRTHSITVHPRLRGELFVNPFESDGNNGSSPLTRGTQRRSSRGPYRRWFIPAYAGNSWIQCAAQRCSTVHPRLRGELLNGAPLSQDQGGSSPLTRGTQKTAAEGCRNKRFIPAYAGNSLLGFYRRSGRTVHPRLRGELT